MRQLFGCVLALVTVLTLVPTVHATRFAVLLNSGSAGQGETRTLDNPLYDQNATQNQNPLFSERVQSLTLDLNQIWQAAGEDVMLTVLTGDDIPPTGNPQLARDPGYFGFSITLTSDETGLPITDLLSDVEFQFTIPTLIPDPAGGLPDALAGGELGYYNEETMMWESEDANPGSPPGGGCSGSNDKVCGKTNHFTVFALGDPANLPEPGTAMVLGASALFALRRRG